MPLLVRQNNREGALITIPDELMRHIFAGRVRYDDADAGGDSFPNDGETFLHVKNEGVGSITVTVTAIASPGRDAVKTIAAGAGEFLGPFPLSGFLATLAVTYSDVTSLTVAVLKI